MKCAVVIPVGPGHEYLVEDSIESAQAAFAAHPGRFSALDIVRIDDGAGALGRSVARNQGVAEAVAREADWIFFLDADDVMHLDAFAAAAPHLDHQDAIWGAIYELAEDESGGVMRSGQIERIRDITDVLVNRPHLTLQMGHFVRASVAQATPFASEMDCGEDFHYYVRLWSSVRCTKLPVPLFYNRRGYHSSGPRSATGSDWNRAVTSLLARECEARAMKARFVLHGQSFEFAISNPFDIIERHFLAGRFFEQKELDTLRSLIAPGAKMLEIGANIGNHVVFMARFMQPHKIIVFEPSPRAVQLLRRNLALNAVRCVDLQFAGMAVAESRGRYASVTADPNNLGATRLVPAADGPIEAAPVDDLLHEPVQFVKIDVEGMELEVLAGAAELIRRSRPAMLVEVANANWEKFEHWCAETRYHVAHRFDYVHSVNAVVVP